MAAKLSSRSDKVKLVHDYNVETSCDYSSSSTKEELDCKDESSYEDNGLLNPGYLANVEFDESSSYDDTGSTDHKLDCDRKPTGFGSPKRERDDDHSRLQFKGNSSKSYLDEREGELLMEVANAKEEEGHNQIDLIESTLDEDRSDDQLKPSSTKCPDEVADTPVEEEKQPAAHRCSVCEKTFLTHARMKKHVYRVHDARRLCKCDLCGATFRKPRVENTLKETQTKDKPSLCKACKSRLSEFSVAGSRTSSDAEGFPQVCLVCGKDLPPKCSQSTLSGTRNPFLCKDCPSVPVHYQPLFNTSGLSRFKRKQSICMVCGRPFPRLCDLKVHMRTHTGERPYTCKVCGKSFAAANNLRKHSVTHTGDKRFVCEFCGKQYTQSSALTKHKVSHSSVKPFSCDICGKFFTCASNLKMHLEIHDYNRPLNFSCHECGRAFSRAFNLKKHLRIHNGEKPYICERCGKAYSDSSNLTKHMFIHNK